MRVVHVYDLRLLSFSRQQLFVFVFGRIRSNTEKPIFGTAIIYWQLHRLKSETKADIEWFISWYHYFQCFFGNKKVLLCYHFIPPPKST